MPSRVANRVIPNSHGLSLSSHNQSILLRPSVSPILAKGVRGRRAALRFELEAR
eukprot:CAMPEP_0201621366 /NCGR_PEP_ID=MMETSP0492-20130828/46679_1 /ASSEMBLY_ACC=CAM_ASM_000837 /TAXON_ID=420259 /ORGANISM="Thalassiosira gravida, Strain GMp14c1" /LENGTH=53 /DNA_ID=CAMNT_0048090881 /DNA_START=67 /DNA_END=224 /DNA_ORIENTATION=+